MSSQPAPSAPTSDAHGYEYDVALGSNEAEFKEEVNRMASDGWDVVSFAIHRPPMAKGPIPVSSLFDITIAALMRRPLQRQDAPTQRTQHGE